MKPRPSLVVYEAQQTETGFWCAVRVRNHSMHSHRLEPDQTIVETRHEKAPIDSIVAELNRAFNQGREFARQW